MSRVQLHYIAFSGNLISSSLFLISECLNFRFHFTPAETNLILKPFHIQDWSISKFPLQSRQKYYIARMKNRAFHSFLRWERAILPIRASSLRFYVLNFGGKGLKQRENRTFRWIWYPAGLKQWLCNPSCRRLFSLSEFKSILHCYEKTSIFHLPLSRQHKSRWSAKDSPWKSRLHQPYWASPDSAKSRKNVKVRQRSLISIFSPSRSTSTSARPTFFGCCTYGNLCVTKPCTSGSEGREIWAILAWSTWK